MFAKSSPDAVIRGRSKIVLGFVQGRSPTEIAASGQASASQVYRVAEGFTKAGLPGLSDRREDNGAAKVTEEYAAALLELVDRRPSDFGYRRPTWTQELFIRVLQKQTGTKIGRTTMSRLLKRLKVRHGRPKPTVGCPWSKARKTRRLNELRRLMKGSRKGTVVVYVDEVDVHLNPKIGPDWMRCGTQKAVLTPGQNEKRYLAGALDARTGDLIWVEAERKNSDLFILLLWKLIQVYPRARRIHVVLDNYRIHDSRQTRLALATLGGRVRLQFLPPYCPDHNRIERVWKDLHDNVTRNHRCSTMQELMSEVRAYLHRRRQIARRQPAQKKAA
ncbi:MAG: IS630 family transposase [Planctomycetes bacterium]|nr:IS630 family transposase [Planctomycetota bacterium]